jgi:hypothetical protein
LWKRKNRSGEAKDECAATGVAETGLNGLAARVVGQHRTYSEAYHMPGDSNLRSDDDQLHSRTSQFALTFNLQLAVGIPMNHPFTVWIATCKRLVESSTQSTSPVYPIKRVLVKNLHAVFQGVVEFADQRGAPGAIISPGNRNSPLTGTVSFPIEILETNSSMQSQSLPPNPQKRNTKTRHPQQESKKSK